MTATPYIEAPWSLYIDENNDVISVTKWVDGPNKGRMAISLARMAMPDKHKTQAQLNASARLMQLAPEIAELLREFINPALLNHRHLMCDRARALLARIEGEK